MNKLLNMYYINFLYMGDWDPATDLLISPVQEIYTFASILSACAWIHSTIDKPVGQQIRNELHLDYIGCWKWPIFVCMHPLHLCEMCVEFCCFDVTYKNHIEMVALHVFDI
jgi:hypothetical protein